MTYCTFKGADEEGEGNSPQAVEGGARRAHSCHKEGDVERRSGGEKAKGRAYEEERQGK